MKKYSNRKIYDNLEKGYVDSREVLDFLEIGDLIEIFDNRTHQDITEDQLYRFLAYQDVESHHRITQNEYRAILKLGKGSLSGFVRYIFDNVDLSEHLSNIKFYSDEEMESIKIEAIEKQKREEEVRMKMFLEREARERGLTKEEEIAEWEKSIEPKRADSFHILNLL